MMAVICSLVMQAQQEGTYKAILSYAVKNHLGHLQIYPPSADSNDGKQSTLGRIKALNALMQSSLSDDLCVPRLIRQASAQSQNHLQNCYLWGIDPRQEELLSNPAQYLIQGVYFEATAKNSIIIGQGLAKKLQVNLGDSLLLQTQSQEGKALEKYFLIQGIAKLPFKNLDKRLIYIPLKTAQKFLHMPHQVSYWAILLKNPQEITSKEQLLKSALPPSLASVRTWKKSQPQLSQIIQSQQWGAGVMLGVLYLVIALGLWMSMVLLTHERREELEVLMSIGVTRSELGFSLGLELVLLGVLGLLLGSLFSIPALFYLMQHPILLSGPIAEAVSGLGLKPALYYHFELSSLVEPNLCLLGGILLVSLYPIYKLSYFQGKNTSLRMWSINGLGLIPSLAWQNLSRNPSRSLIIVLSIGIGLGVGAFMWAFANGLQTQRLQYQLNHSLGHLKITSKDFDEEKPLQAYFDLTENLRQKLHQLEQEVTAFSPRLNVYGMLHTTQDNLGVDVYGIHPSHEQAVFQIYQNLISGTYLKDTAVYQPILVGQKLAENLNLKIKDKTVLRLPHLQQKAKQDTFLVAGVYTMHNQNFEETHVFILAEDFQKMTGLQATDYHQITLKTPDYHKAISFSKQLSIFFPSLQVRSWAEIAPEFAYLEEVLGQFFTIFTSIILLALSFAMMNMMLMTVLERQQEWAMLIAIGTQKRQIFALVGLETLLLAFLGLCLGLAGAWAGIVLAQLWGIDLQYFDATFANMGIDTKIYPFLKWDEYLSISLLLFVAALLSAWYPAWLALKTNIVKALQK